MMDVLHEVGNCDYFWPQGAATYNSIRALLRRHLIERVWDGDMYPTGAYRVTATGSAWLKAHTEFCAAATRDLLGTTSVY